MALVTPTIFRWPLDDFGEQFAKATFEQKWESGDFAVQGVPNAKFYLQFDPKGVHNTLMNYCGLFLYVRDFGEFPSIRLKFKIWFENRKKKQLKKSSTEYKLHAAQDNWGWPHVFTQTELLKFANSGPLVVFCKLVPLEPCWATERLVAEAPLGVLGKIAADFDAGDFADVEIRVQGKSFKVAKMIISLGSPVFRKMFTHDSKEKKTGVVEIKKEDAKMVELLLRFLYSGKVEGLKKVAARLLPVADCYEVLHLTAMCLESLYENLSVKTALRDLKLAFAHDHKGVLTQRFLDFTKQNFHLVRQQPDWSDDFMRENPEIVKKIMALLSP